MGKLKRVEIPTISSTRFDCDLENHDRQSHNRMKKKWKTHILTVPVERQLSFPHSRLKADLLLVNVHPNEMKRR